VVNYWQRLPLLGVLLPSYGQLLIPAYLKRLQKILKLARVDREIDLLSANVYKLC